MHLAADDRSCSKLLRIGKQCQTCGIASEDHAGTRRTWSSARKGQHTSRPAGLGTGSHSLAETPALQSHCRRVGPGLQVERFSPLRGFVSLFKYTISSISKIKSEQSLRDFLAVHSVCKVISRVTWQSVRLVTNGCDCPVHFLTKFSTYVSLSLVCKLFSQGQRCCP